MGKASAPNKSDGLGVRKIHTDTFLYGETRYQINPATLSHKGIWGKQNFSSLVEISFRQVGGRSEFPNAGSIPEGPSWREGT